MLPVSVTIGTVLVALLGAAAGRPGVTQSAAAGLTFIVTMLALAMLEHWMLVLPIPFGRLWNWVLAVRQPCKTRETRQAGSATT